MSLDLHEKIKASDIIYIKCLKDLKVYQLFGIDNSTLVIKIESRSVSLVKQAGVVVKAIDPAIKMKPLSLHEIHELKLYCSNFYEIEEYFDALAIGVKSPYHEQKKAIELLKETLDSLDLDHETILKMKAVHLLHIEDVMNETYLGGKKGKLTQFVNALKRPGGLENLGKVIAGDLFNGNSDRIWPKSPSQHTFGTFKIITKTLVNLGNILVIGTENGFTPSMLDYFDPNSEYKFINNAVDSNWPGTYLSDNKKRHAFCIDIIDDLENVLHPNKSWYSIAKFGGNAVWRLETGMIQGKDLIKKRLLSKYPDRGKWSDGIRTRYGFLGN